jgi:hypothetical protein
VVNVGELSQESLQEPEQQTKYKLVWITSYLKPFPIGLLSEPLDVEK